jgi:hypothetical protein
MFALESQEVMAFSYLFSPDLKGTTAKLQTLDIRWSQTLVPGMECLFIIPIPHKNALTDSNGY